VGILWLAACASGERGSSPVTTVRDSAGLTIVENDLTRSSAACTIPATPTISIGTDVGEEPYELHRVMGARRLSDGRIVVVNQGSQHIRFYDQSGKFLTQAGRKGQGPGEFSAAFYLWVLPGDTIWVGNSPPWQYLIFGPDGTWKRTVTPNPRDENSPEVMNVLDNGRMVLAERIIGLRNATGFTMKHLTIVLHEADGTLIDTIGVYPNGRTGNMGENPSGPWLSPLFESFARASAAGSKVVVGHGSVPELFIYDAADSLRLERVVRWTTPDRTITPEAVAAERKRIREEYPNLEPAMFRMMIEPQIREDRPVADVFPAFAGVAIGRDGRIWVREYPTPDRASSRIYLVFDPDGRFVCRADMPAFDNVVDFGSDYLLAHDRDSLGVERVLQFPISPTADRR
jgi:hypothetical protein